MKVSELSGALLDYWVAVADGKKPTFANSGCTVNLSYPEDRNPFGASYEFSYAPSQLWASGGEIIERENIALLPPTRIVKRYDGQYICVSEWHAVIERALAHGGDIIGKDDKNPLVAAMRCFVMMKVGNEVPDSINTVR